MDKNAKLMEMLIGYAAAHQHPFNVGVHLLGIPIIMLGVLIPLTWISFDLGGASIGLAHVLVVGMFVFYLTLDRVFAAVFLLFGIAIAELAAVISTFPTAVSGGVAAAAFFGGYILQFVGHAVEKSMPVLVRHPIQANLAAPFFVVVEVFGLLGLRKELFAEVQTLVAHRRAAEPGAR